MEYFENAKKYILGTKLILDSVQKRINFAQREA